jgi:ribosomal protein S17
MEQVQLERTTRKVKKGIVVSNKMQKNCCGQCTSYFDPSALRESDHTQ